MLLPASYYPNRKAIRLAAALLHVSDFGHLHHRLGGEERSIHRAHVDVPAFALGRLPARQVAHRCLPALHSGGAAANDKSALKRIEGVFRVGHWTIAIREPVDVVAEQ